MLPRPNLALLIRVVIRRDTLVHWKCLSCLPVEVMGTDGTWGWSFSGRSLHDGDANSGVRRPSPSFWAHEYIAASGRKYNISVHNDMGILQSICTSACMLGA